MKVQRPGLVRLCRDAQKISVAVGTPFYAYDWPTLEKGVERILADARRAGLNGNARFYLAFFALPNVVIVNRLLRLDKRLGINCNTPEEIAALKKASFDQWKRVVFTGGVLPSADLLRVAKTGCLVNVASEGNLKTLLELPHNVRLGLRLDFSDTALKGVRVPSIKSYVALSRTTGRHITALHAYPGTEVRDIDALCGHADRLIAIASKCPSVREINFGGGFWYDYGSADGDTATMVDFRSYFSRVKASLRRSSLSGKVLAWEPGRIVYAGSGTFVTRVLEVRSTALRSADVYVDASFTQFPSPKIRNRQHQIVVLSQDGRRRSGAAYEARICGATTLSTDQILPHPCLLPAVEPGDLIMILDAGAYGHAGSYNFLGKARPPEVILDASGWKLIRRRQRAEHLLDGLYCG